MLTSADIQLRDEYMLYIGPIIERLMDLADEQKRASLIPARAKEVGRRKKLLYDLVRRYLQRGQVQNAVLGDRSACGGKGKCHKSGTVKRGRPRLFSEDDGINVDEDTAKIIAEDIALFYETPQEHSFTKAFEFMLARDFASHFVYEDGVPVPILLPPALLPTRDQARYWYNKLSDPVRAMLLRKGMRKFNLAFRALNGRASQLASMAYEVVTLDFTKLDTYMRSGIDNSVLEKLTFGITMDVFTEAITGFLITSEQSAYFSAALLIESMYANKVELCARYGVTIDDEDWPMSGYLPRAILADRGELAGNKPIHIVTDLLVDIANTDSYRAEQKGMHEVQFHLTNKDVFHDLPGAVRRAAQRGDKSPSAQAAAYVAEVAALVIRRILHWNKTHRKHWLTLDADVILDHIDPTPNNLWHWSKKKRSGALVAKSEDIVRMNLLPHGVATVTERGIKFQERFYTCPKAEREHWREKFRMGKKFEPLQVAFDPRTLGVLYLIIDGGKSLERCRLVDWMRQYSNRTSLEFDTFYKTRRRLEVKHNHEKVASKVRMNAHVQHTAKEATARAKKLPATPDTKRRAVKLRENTQRELGRTRPLEAWKDLGTSTGTPIENGDMSIHDGYLSNDAVRGPSIRYVPDDDYEELEARRKAREQGSRAKE
jgi:hypothetical protein